VPSYEGKVVFVNAITDDAAAKQLASQFRFQYIPTSFFLEPGGSVSDSYTGPLTEEQMRARLDALATK
jgi:thioredoxin-like negative regulator of GroEL